MAPPNVIDMHRYLLKKAVECLEEGRLLSAEPQKALHCFLKAFPHADADLKNRMLLFLSGDPESAWPVLSLMLDPRETEAVRQAAALHLCHAGGRMADTGSLMVRLTEEARSEDSFARANALLAMGWPANAFALAPLTQGMKDPVTEVREAAVCSLVTIGGERAFALLMDGLEGGYRSEMRAILCHLWRFEGKRARVTAAYRRALLHPDAEVRLDALAGLERLGGAGDRLSDYVTCLGDGDPRVRLLAIARLGRMGPKALRACRPAVSRLAKDGDPAVRQAARDLLNRPYVLSDGADAPPGGFVSG